MINQAGCTYWDGGDVFDPNLDESSCNGTYYNGEASGFQFELFGITVSGTSGGFAQDAGFTISTSATTVLAFSMEGTTIKEGEGILTTISFVDHLGADICFGNNSDLGTDSNNVIPDTTDFCSGPCPIEVDWGDCECPLPFQVDACGTCGGDGIPVDECDCFGNILDECGECGGDNTSCLDCEGIVNGDALLDNCGTCDNNPDNDCDLGCDEIWGSGLQLDVCGECGGPGLGEGLYYTDCWDGDEYCSIYDCPIDPSSASYKIYRSGGANSLLGAPIAEIQGITEYIDLNLDYSEIYCYTVTYIDNGIESDPSDQVCAITEPMPVVLGCMSIYAANYDENVTYDDGSCWFVNTGCNVEDGEGAIADSCGICDTDPNNDCVPDCFGVWGGSAIIDECGECGGPGILEGKCDCSGNIFDECGICGGDGASENYDCFGTCLIDLDCFGECGGDAKLDDCGVCNGNNSDDIGCGCFEPAPTGCDNNCGSTLEFDECGVCGGDGSLCASINSWTPLTAVGGTNQIELYWQSPQQNMLSSSNVIINEFVPYLKTSLPTSEDYNCDREVCLYIENVDVDAGTLDIYMINQQGCKYWESSEQVFDASMDESTCVLENGIYFDGHVGGFQFELLGITITGGTAPAGLMASTSATSILAFSLTGATIPPGGDVVSTISFSDFEGADICFGNNPDNNVISDANANPAFASWGECYCGAGIDECGVCGGNGIPEGQCDCEGNILDECGVCNGPGLGAEAYFTSCWDENEYCSIDECPIDPNGLSFKIYKYGSILIEEIQGLTTYTHTGLESGTEYCYTVTYMDSGIESEHSHLACATTTDVTGCMDQDACNYDATATANDMALCWYPSSGCDCQDDRFSEVDECGVCDVDPTNDCVQDCAGNWGGPDGDSSTDDDLIVDVCGVCGGDGFGCGLSIEDLSIPEEYNISNIYPNPFNPVTNIEYALPENTVVEIKVYNINGQEIETIFDSYQLAGYHNIYWDATNQPSGVYLVVMMSSSFRQTKQVVLMK